MCDHRLGRYGLPALFADQHDLVAYFGIGNAGEVEAHMLERRATQDGRVASAHESCARVEPCGTVRRADRDDTQSHSGANRKWHLCEEYLALEDAHIDR